MESEPTEQAVVQTQERKERLDGKEETAMSVMFESEGRREPFSMPPQRDTHKAWKSKAIGYKTKRLYEKDFITGNAYQDSLVFDMRLFSKVLIHIKEVGATNAIKYNLLACLDPSMWKALKSDQAVVAGAEATEAVTDAWNWVKLQVASSVADSAGKVNAFITGKTP